MLIAFLLLLGPAATALGVALARTDRATATIAGTGIAAALCTFAVAAAGWPDLGEGRTIGHAVFVSVAVSVVAGLMYAGATGLGFAARRWSLSPVPSALACAAAVVASWAVTGFGVFVLSFAYAANVTCGIDAYECPI